MGFSTNFSFSESCEFQTLKSIVENLNSFVYLFDLAYGLIPYRLGLNRIQKIGLTTKRDQLNSLI